MSYYLGVFSYELDPIPDPGCLLNLPEYRKKMAAWKEQHLILMRKVES